MERAAARREAGARSPTSGNMSWGVTVRKAQMKPTPVKTRRLVVVQRMIQRRLAARQRRRTRGRRLKTSPSGQRVKRPMA